MISPTGTPPMDAITSLLAERQRYEAWIATLETRRGSTPAHVYERVRADYEKRLTAVMDQLAGRSGDLESTVNSLAARVAELMGEETTKRDERAEAELRAAVGEFTPEQWSEISSKSDAEIARIAAQRGTIGSELAQVQDLLVQATRKSDALTPRSAAIVQAEVNAALGQASSPRPAAPPMAAAPPAPPPAASPPPADRGGRDAMLPDFDELAFLKSVVEPRDAAARQAAAAAAANYAAERPQTADRAAAPPPPPADVAPPAPRPAAPAAPPSSAPEAPRALADSAPAAERGGYMSAADLAARGLTMGGAGTSAPAPPRQAAGGSSAPAASSPSGGPSTSPSDSPAGASAAGAAAAAASASRSEGLRMSNSVPAFLKDVPAEQVKTLKCQECGTMNYPTEWYCERCGGELAAM